MIKKIVSVTLFVTATLFSFGQEGITPKQLIELNRVSALGMTEDNSQVVYQVSKVDVANNTRSSKYYMILADGGRPMEIKDPANHLIDRLISPDGSKRLYDAEVKIERSKKSQ